MKTYGISQNEKAPVFLPKTDRRQIHCEKLHSPDFCRKVLHIFLLLLFAERVAALFILGADYNLANDDMGYVNSGITFARTGVISIYRMRAWLENDPFKFLATYFFIKPLSMTTAVFYWKELFDRYGEVLMVMRYVIVALGCDVITDKRSSPCLEK